MLSLSGPDCTWDLRRETRVGVFVLDVRINWFDGIINLGSFKWNLVLLWLIKKGIFGGMERKDWVKIDTWDKMNSFDNKSA